MLRIFRLKLMKKTFVLLFILIISFSSAQISWMNLQQATEAQKTNPKKILINFYADWCNQCKSMDKNTFNNPVIEQIINENFYPVKFNSEGNETVSFMGRTFTNQNLNVGKKKNSLHDFTKFMNVNAVPAVIFLDVNNQPITMLQGALTAKELEPYLILISNEEYKKIDNREKWQNYLQKFKSKIKD